MFLKGLYTASVTPFDSEGRLDEASFRRHLRFQIQQGADGIVLLGTTGEAPTLTEKEKKRVVEIGREEIKGHVVFMVGTGSYSTRQTIENTLFAQEHGADAVLIVTPYYNKPSQEGLHQHFKAISSAVSVPICLYNHQGRTGQNIETRTLERLADLPRVIGVKEASGDIAQMTDVVDRLSRSHPEFSVLSGDDSLALPLMALGGHGVVSVVGNLLPAPMKALVNACQAGDFETARTLHYRLLPIFRAAFIETNPVPIKAAMNQLGLAVGGCRLPLCDLQPEHRERLNQLIEHFPKEWLANG